MLSKTSLQSLSTEDVHEFQTRVIRLYHCFHDLRQAHIELVSHLSNPRKAFVISDTMVEDNAELYASVIDLERDYVKYIQLARHLNHIVK